MSKAKVSKKGPSSKKDIEEQEELEFFLIDEDSLVNLTEHVAGLENMITEIRNEHDELREQLRDLENRIRLARYN